jgi:hypothetical protein
MTRINLSYSELNTTFMLRPGLSSSDSFQSQTCLCEWLVRESFSFNFSAERVQLQNILFRTHKRILQDTRADNAGFNEVTLFKSYGSVAKGCSGHTNTHKIMSHLSLNTE